MACRTKLPLLHPSFNPFPAVLSLATTMAHVDTTTLLPTYDLSTTYTNSGSLGDSVRGITPFVGQWIGW